MYIPVMDAMLVVNLPQGDETVKMTTYKKNCRNHKTKFVTAVCTIHTTVGWDGVRVDGKKIDCISDSSDAFKSTHHHLVLSNTVATVDLGPNW